MYGRSDKSNAWIVTEENRAHKVAENYTNHLNGFKFEQRVAALTKLAALVSEKVKFQLLQSLGNIYFHQSVQKLENDEFNTSSQYISECSFYYEECSKILRILEASPSNTFDTNFISYQSLESFNQQVGRQLLITDATRCKHDADSLLASFIDCAEPLDAEKVWDTIDLYRVAIIKAKGARSGDIEYYRTCL
jgi:hypothetical protein